MLRTYVMAGVRGASGEVTCGACGFSSSETSVTCRCDWPRAFLLTTPVRQHIGVRISGRTSAHTVSVVGDTEAAGMYLCTRNLPRVPITRVDTGFVAFSASQSFPTNLEGFAFAFVKYVHANNKSRRFVMRTDGIPILDNRAVCEVRRETYCYLTEINWCAGPVKSICILRWATGLGNIVEQVDTVKMKPEVNAI